MRRTDYEKVSKVYDENADRKRIPIDEIIGGVIERGRSRRIGVLDLACGTGNYLEVQTKAFAGAPIDWFGVDASQAMLARARSKLVGVDLQEARAEQIPF